MHRLVLIALCVLCLGLGASAQLAYFSTEFFIVPDYRSVTSGSFAWDNFVLEDLSFVQYAITFDAQTSSGSGPQGGPAYPDGDYIVSPIWLLTSNMNGFTTGHAHFQANGGHLGGGVVGGAFDQSHYNGSPDQLQGWHITRMDGQPFQFVSVDHLNTVPGLLIGTSFTDYSSVCSWDIHDASTGLIPSVATWQTYALFTTSSGTTFTPGPGEAAMPGLSSLDINTSANANGSGVADPCGDTNGPFFANASAGGTISFRFNGQPNQPIVLLNGALSPVAATFGAIGQMDIGTPNPAPPFVPNNLVILANGFDPGFFNGLFNTGPNGTANMSFTVPAIPPGFATSFQALIFNTQPSVARLSNAVQVTF